MQTRAARPPMGERYDVSRARACEARGDVYHQSENGGIEEECDDGVQRDEPS